MITSTKYSGIRPASWHSLRHIYHRADGHHRENLDRATIVHQQEWMPLLFVLNATGWSYRGKIKYSAPLPLTGALTTDSPDSSS